MRPLVEKRSNRVGVMGHVIADYPDGKTVRDAISAMHAAGVALIEIQIPFSEPMADGPLFMHANHEALEHGVELSDCLDLMAEVTSVYQEIPFVFMTYANILFKRGYQRFVKEAKKAGARGAIIPDLPVDMAREYLEACRAQEFANIVVIPPNVSDQRLAMLCKHAMGLIYAVARTGVTGQKTEFGYQLDRFLKRIRDHSDLPIAVGFGVRGREDVEFLQGRADLAVIGSRGLEVLKKGGVKQAQKFWQEVCQG